MCLTPKLPAIKSATYINILDCKLNHFSLVRTTTPYLSRLQIKGAAFKEQRRMSLEDGQGIESSQTDNHTADEMGDGDLRTLDWIELLRLRPPPSISAVVK